MDQDELYLRWAKLYQFATDALGLSRWSAETFADTHVED